MGFILVNSFSEAHYLLIPILISALKTEYRRINLKRIIQHSINIILNSLANRGTSKDKCHVQEYENLKKNEPHTLANADRVDDLTFGVGHGDCQLIEFPETDDGPC